MKPATFRDWRKRLGFTQSEAAAKLAVSLRTIQEWEGGRTAIPGLAPLACAAVAYGLPPIGDTA